VGVGHSPRRDSGPAGGSAIGDHRFENHIKAVSLPNQFVIATLSDDRRRTEPALADTAQFISIIIFCQSINVV